MRLTIDEIIFLGSDDLRTETLVENAINAYRNFVMYQNVYWYEPYRISCDEIIEILGDAIDWPDAVRLAVMDAAINGIGGGSGF